MTVEHSNPSTSEVAPSRPTASDTFRVDAVPDLRAGNQRALLAVRLLAAAALVVSAYVHGRLALDVGMGGPLLARGHLFAAHAVLTALIAAALLVRDNRAWLMAVVLSAFGLAAILASVYRPLPAVGPFPGIDEPTWLLNKALAAFVEVTVIALWLIRRIAPQEPAR